MRIGKRKHRLQIQAPVQVQDQTTGAITTGWSTIAEVWASIEPLKGRELLLGDQIVAQFDTRINFRWSAVSDQVTAAHRGMHQGSVFNFVNIAHDKLAQREVEVMARSGVNDG